MRSATSNVSRGRPAVRRFVEEQVVALTVDPGLPAEAQHVAEPGGRHERDPGATALQDHVGGQRRAVHEPGHALAGDASGHQRRGHAVAHAPPGSSGVVRTL